MQILAFPTTEEVSHPSSSWSCHLRMTSISHCESLTDQHQEIKLRLKSQAGSCCEHSDWIQLLWGENPAPLTYIPRPVQSPLGVAQKIAYHFHIGTGQTSRIEPSSAVQGYVDADKDGRGGVGGELFSEQSRCQGAVLGRGLHL